MQILREETEELITAMLLMAKHSKTRNLMEKISKFLSGHSHGEIVVCLCFILHEILDQAENPKERGIGLSAIMRLIDKPKDRVI
jgi:hypothetical protein